MKLEKSDMKTCELVQELRQREGVQMFFIEPQAQLEMQVDDKNETQTGPAIILVITD